MATIYERNYKAIERIAKGLLEGEVDYMKFESKGFMTLVFEKIGENEISIAHYYEQEGDLVQDPEMTLQVDKERKMVFALTYYQPALGINQRVYPQKGHIIKSLRKELNNFLNQWLRNINLQGYEVAKTETY